MKVRSIALSIMVMVAQVCMSLRGQTTTKILDHGSDGEKLVFVVLGDGYTAGDQQKYELDVKTLVLDGVFGHDFYKDNIDAFNIYRVDLISSQSGVSRPTFAKNTALRVIYSGDWNRCWLEPSDDTDERITNAINVKKYDFVLIVANESGYGGCRRGSRLYVTSGDPWDVVAHEYGHGIAGLYDEYSADGGGAYTGDPVNNLNCSTVLDRQNVVWSKLIGKDIDLPSDGLQNIDSNDTVGEFEGCNYAQSGIYRPVQQCRMNSNTPHFCPVCLAAMTSRVQPYRSPVTSVHGGPQGAPPPPVASKFVNLVVRIEKGHELAIQKVSEVIGPLLAPSTGSPAYVAALTAGGQPNVTHLLVDDPFIVRGFRDPDHKEKGEHISQSSSATIILNVAGATLASIRTDVGLELLKVEKKHFAGLVNGKPLDAKEIDLMTRTGDAKTVMDVSAKSFGDKMRVAAIK